MIDLDELEQYASGQIIPFPSDRLREIAAEVRNCREAWAQMARAKERESARIAVLEAALGGAISDLDSHDCQNVAEFEAALGESKAGNGG